MTKELSQKDVYKRHDLLLLYYGVLAPLATSVPICSLAAAAR